MGVRPAFFQGAGRMAKKNRHPWKASQGHTGAPFFLWTGDRYRRKGSLAGEERHWDHRKGHVGGCNGNLIMNFEFLILNAGLFP